MNKLRLIKPWRLSAIRQTLTSDYRLCEPVCLRPVARTGPAERLNPSLLPAGYRGAPESRTQVRMDRRDIPSHHAPDSDVIFVASTTNIRP